MKTLILVLAIMVWTDVGADARSHRKAYSAKEQMAKALTTTPVVNLTLSPTTVPKPPLNAKQEPGTSLQGAPAEGPSGGEGVKKQIVRRQALQYTKNEKIDNGARARCVNNPNGTVTVTRKGKAFTGPTENPEPTFRRASHLKQNVNFAQANGLKSPSEGKYIVVNTGGIDYRSFVQPQNDDYYFWTTETDRQLALSGGSPQIQKMGIELLGNGECQLSWGGGGGGKDGGDLPVTNNKGVGG